LKSVLSARAWPLPANTVSAANIGAIGRIIIVLANNQI
jgi:hypothetical protein